MHTAGNYIVLILYDFGFIKNKQKQKKKKKKQVVHFPLLKYLMERVNYCKRYKHSQMLHANYMGSGYHSSLPYKFSVTNSFLLNEKYIKMDFM